MSRFRPTVEVLDARTLPSAVFAGADAQTADLSHAARFVAEQSAPAAVADPSGESAAKKTPSKPPAKPDTSHLKITLTDVLVSSYS